MPTDKRRILLTVIDDRPFQVLGLDPAEHGASQIWGALSRYAGLIEEAGRELDRQLSKEEWCLLADVLNGCADLWDYSGTTIPSRLLLIAQVEDAQRLDGTGNRWFGDGTGDAAVAQLVGRLKRLSALHCDAILYAVRYFWSQPDIDIDSPWWRVATRTMEAQSCPGRRQI